VAQTSGTVSDSGFCRLEHQWHWSSSISIGTGQVLIKAKRDLQSKSCKGVHDEIDPEELDRTQHSFIVIISNCRNKSQEDSCDVDSDLELGAS
jgi:hypothetical protein